MGRNFRGDLCTWLYISGRYFQCSPVVCGKAGQRELGPQRCRGGARDRRRARVGPRTCGDGDNLVYDTLRTHGHWISFNLFAVQNSLFILGLYILFP